MTKQHSPSPGSDEFRSPQPLIAGRPYFVASIVPLVTGLVGLTPPLASWVVGAAIAGIGALRLGVDDAGGARLRELADSELASGATPASAPFLSWRASELVTRGNRGSSPAVAHDRGRIERTSVPRPLSQPTRRPSAPRPRRRLAAPVWIAGLGEGRFPLALVGVHLHDPAEAFLLAGLLDRRRRLFRSCLGRRG